jgi:hypothetical protein
MSYQGLYLVVASGTNIQTGIHINMHTIIIQCGIKANDISVACKQRIGDVRHLLIMHIIKLRSSNFK